MNKYQYTILLSPVNESKLLSFLEKTEAKVVMKVPIEVKSNLSEKEKVADLESKIGQVTPDGQYEFTGYENLVKVINKTLLEDRKDEMRKM